MQQCSASSISENRPYFNAWKTGADCSTGIWDLHRAYYLCTNAWSTCFYRQSTVYVELVNGVRICRAIQFANLSI